MKFISVLAVLVLISATVFAAPQPWWGHGHNKPHGGGNKEINQSAGGAGNGGSNSGLGAGILSGGVLSKSENNNNIKQSAEIH